MRVVRWVPAAAWAGVIFWFSALPGSSVPGRFSTLGHFAVYAVFGALLVFALGKHDARAFLTAVLIASLYGISDEFHQSFVPARTPDAVDWGVDTAGAFVGAAGFVALRRSRSSGEARQ